MGTPGKATQSTSLAGALFTPVQQRVLGLLFGQPARRFQSAEIIRLANSGTGATHRFLLRLAASGLVLVTTEGQQKYYRANPGSPVFEELCGLVRKTVGLTLPIQEALAPFRDRIRAAFVYGSIAQGTDRADSDIDILILSNDLDYPALFEATQAAEHRLSRTLNPTLMTSREWKRKRSLADGFVARILKQARLFMIGTEDDL